MTYPRRRFKLGETVKFVCHKGYELQESSFVRCSKQGIWQKKFPYCIPLKCRVRKSIRHGTWNLVPSEFKKRMWAFGKRLGTDSAIESESQSAFISVGDKLNVTCDNNFEVF